MCLKTEYEYDFYEGLNIIRNVIGLDLKFNSVLRNEKKYKKNRSYLYAFDKRYIHHYNRIEKLCFI